MTEQENDTEYQSASDTLYRRLAALRVVLIDTSHPGNIGSTARAMKTMGLETLHLVRPARFPDPEATALASGAEDLLLTATVHEQLDQALQGCSLVLGTSARRRSLSVPILDPQSAARALLAAPGPVALLFGSERVGLTNAELDRCQLQVQIPANPAYSSLNLAQAVQVLSYELRRAATETPPDSLETQPQVATAEQMEGFYQQMEQVLAELEFLDPQNPRQMMRRLRRLFSRARPDPSELHILRGILSALGKQARAQQARARAVQGS